MITPKPGETVEAWFECVAPVMIPVVRLLAGGELHHAEGLYSIPAEYLYATESEALQAARKLRIEKRDALNSEIDSIDARIAEIEMEGQK